MLYGWVEVGVSNNTLFLNESNEDVIVRTIYGTSKVILGNTQGTYVPAGMYIHGNNVGIQKVPSSNMQLDVLGAGRMHDLYVGYSNDPGSTIFNGAVVWKDVTKHSSNQMELVVRNSNERTSISYNNVERIQVTDDQGLTLNDTVYVTEDVFANAFQVTSDRRWKHDIVPSDAKQDTDTLRKMAVYNYTMKDRFMKGFIAQEVETVFPRAVAKRKGIVPLAHKVRTSQGKLYLPDAPLWLEPGDEIILSDMHGSSSTKSIYTVHMVQEDGHFDVLGPLPLFEEGWLEGKLVGDVCTLDINQITALNTSVLQSILSRLETLEKFVHENK